MYALFITLFYIIIQVVILYYLEGLSKAQGCYSSLDIVDGFLKIVSIIYMYMLKVMSLSFSPLFRTF